MIQNSAMVQGESVYPLPANPRICGWVSQAYRAHCHPPAPGPLLDAGNVCSAIQFQNWPLRAPQISTTFRSCIPPLLHLFRRIRSGRQGVGGQKDLWVERQKRLLREWGEKFEEFGDRPFDANGVSGRRRKAALGGHRPVSVRYIRIL